MRGDFSLSRSVCLLGLTVLCMPLAQAAEKDELASAKNLIEQVQMALERANLAEKQADTPTRPRYDFDYLRIKADLNTIKAGIDHYLTPSRAQQQASGTLSGHYRQEHPQ
ncbi:putative exported protein [Xenorhabdus nematophila ATCC 19061]|uniref:Exported protein n=1 Tax=Xenorhabdus nematophila (strain ATCC 19061 / DSM 3370 / CCUG 14189 / LMG 1036 / NCIMB 9965 / AN6) TaxID=406817 RepID=D3VAD9_XENNA|nr:RAQPRD family integrative conjugative element protein [Xenorhabdus nematophila]CBJ91703.1 putative exported protein [Xenorhabdus nematophila ATCC 19061]CEK24520.1 putative exported protein [Xenorhabdus nematophila AN6/1]